MISIFKKSLLALGFVFVGSLSNVFATITSENVKSRIKDIYEIAKPLIDQKVESQNIWDFVRSPYKFVKEEVLEDGLIDVCDDLLLQKLPIEQETKIKSIKSELIEYLKSFIAKGTDWQNDYNVAFIFDEMNPNYTLYFANPEGKIKTRKYNLKIWSLGAKIEFAFRSQLIMMINDADKPLSYYDSNQEFILDKGMDVSLTVLPLALPHILDMRYNNEKIVAFAAAALVPGFCAVFASIKDTPNKILILGMVHGISLGVSYVFGGRMTPIKA